MKSFVVLFALIILKLPAFSQGGPAIQQLQQFVQKDSATKDSIGPRNPLYTSNGLNYLQPIKRQLKTGIPKNNEKGQGRFATIAQDFAFASDYISAAEYGPREYDSMSLAGYQDVRNYLDTLKSVQFSNARKYILSRAVKEQVIMINESRYLPEHRAFTISLLQDLYLAGFRTWQLTF